MTTSRLEAFSDGVLAIIITIMVLQLNAPKETTLEALSPKIGVFISYLISFVYVGIYWNNHHHLFQYTKKVNGKILWANLHFLFWLSLVPFTTSWVGENHLDDSPLALYGFTLLMSGISFIILQMVIIKNDPKYIASKIIRLIKIDYQKISLLFYIIGILFSFYIPWLAVACYVTPALLKINSQIYHQKNFNKS
jgi:uncharacterized membrane protein